MRLEAEVAFEWGGVGVSYRYVARLHWDEFFVGFKVVIFWKDASLGGEFDDDVGMMCGEDLINKFFICEVGFNEGEVIELL